MYAAKVIIKLASYRCDVRLETLRLPIHRQVLLPSIVFPGNWSIFWIQVGRSEDVGPGYSVNIEQTIVGG